MSRKIELVHAPDKYPLLENYSGWELVDTVVLRDKPYVRALPIYCSEDAETWFIEFPAYMTLDLLSDPIEQAVALFKIETSSAKGILFAVKLFQEVAE